jgi:hypothetical protein
MANSIFRLRSACLLLALIFTAAEARSQEVALPAGVEIAATVDNSTPSLGDQITVRVTATNTGESAADIILFIDIPVTWKAGAKVGSASQGTYDVASGKWAVNVGANASVGASADESAGASSDASAGASAGGSAVLEVTLKVSDEVPHAIVVRQWSDPPPAPDAVVRPRALAFVVVNPRCASCRVVTTPKECPDVPCCKQEDACIVINVPGPRPKDGAFTANGVSSFIAIFNSAATRGVENATIRAFNSTRACPQCKDCSDDPCTSCGTCPGFPSGWKAQKINGTQIVQLGRIAFDVATGKQVLPESGELNPNFQFELRRNTTSKKYYVEWVRWLDANRQEQSLPANMPSRSFDLETGDQIDPVTGTAFGPGVATHKLIMTKELWFARQL